MSQVERMLADTIRRHRLSVGHGQYAGTYAGLMLMFSGCMLTFTMVILMPKFEEIFLDFQTPLPKVTVALTSLCSWIALHSVLIGTAILFCAVLLVIAIAVFTWRTYKSVTPYGWA